MKQTDFAKLVSSFLTKYLVNERGKAYNTILAYRDTLSLLIEFLELRLKIRVERITINKINRKVILEFLEWIENERRCSISTRNVRLAALRTFFKYVQYESIENLDRCREIRSIPSKPDVQKTMNYLTLEAIKLLLELPDTSTKRGLRDLAIISLMYDTGGRVQELIDLTPADLRLGKNSTVKLTGKGRKTRLVPLLNSQTEIIRNYIKRERLDMPVKADHPLFTNSRNEKLTRAGVTYILRKYFTMAKKKSEAQMPKSITCHTLRHSKAMHLLEAGLGLVYIRDILGHSSIKTTEIYARVDSKQKRDALNKVVPNLHPDEEALWVENEGIKRWLKSL